MHVSLILQRLRFDPSTSEYTRRKTVRQLTALCCAISANFAEVQHANQIRLKHLHYLRDRWLPSQDYSPSTLAEYHRAMRLMVRLLGKEQYWLGPLKMKQSHSIGGRPSSANVLKSRAKNRRGAL